jgi:hypothetical protein
MMAIIARVDAMVELLLQRFFRRSKIGQLAKQIISAASTGTRKPIKKKTPAATTNNSRMRLSAVLLMNCDIHQCPERGSAILSVSLKNYYRASKKAKR